MSRLRPATLKVAFGCTLIALVAAGCGGWRYHSRRAELRAGLVEDARKVAVAFAAADNGAAPDQTVMKERLQRLRRADTRWRFVRLFRIQPGSGRGVMLAEAADAMNQGDASPGEDAAGKPESAALPAVARTGIATIVGPWTDRHGTWLAGCAVVGGGDAPPPPDETIPVIAIGVNAADWTKELWLAALGRALGVSVLLGAPWLVWGLRRRWRNGRGDVVETLSEAMEQSRSAIVIVDRQGRIEYVNRGICAQIGYTREELMQRKWQDIKVAEIGRPVLANLRARVRSGRPWEGEWTIRRKDGTTYPVRGGVTPVTRHDGSVACFVAVFDDMTEAKAREAELREARDQAEVGDRAKGRFLATMSHEVRTPLNGIVGFTSLLLETSLSSEQREYVHTIRMSTEALIQLTGDILDFARIESGKLKLDALATDPRECVEDALDLHAAKAADKGIELLHRFDPALPAAVVTDGGRLRQVLVNLIGNAVKFTERGEVEIAVRRLSDAEAREAGGNADECHLEFSVRDTGIGIADENLSKLFRPFSQVDESTTRRYGGTGLGLAICLNLVELMGGTIGVTSEPGRGSTFRFTVRAPAAAPPPPPRRLTGVRVALVTRSGPLRRELTGLVQSWQGDVIAVDTLAELASGTADIAVVELNQETAREFAAQPEPPAPSMTTKVFGLVPVTLSNDLRTALRAHFRLLVSKPVHHDAFFALLAGSWGSVPTLQPPTHFGFRVLVVEDNPVNQRLVHRVLTSLGCSATMVDDARRAVTLLAERTADFDLVVLDFNLPELNGINALHEIRAGRAGAEAQTIWIIALTADAREEQRSRGLAEGLNDYLTKPLKLSELEAALKRFRSHRAALKH